MAISRNEALELAERMISAASSYERPEFQSGFFDGLVAGRCQCGLFTEGEIQNLRKRMRENLRDPHPAWWDIASRIGF